MDRYQGPRAQQLDPAALARFLQFMRAYQSRQRPQTPVQSRSPQQLLPALLAMSRQTNPGLGAMQAPDQDYSAGRAAARNLFSRGFGQ